MERRRERQRRSKLFGHQGYQSLAVNRWVFIAIIGVLMAVVAYLIFG